MHKKPLTFQLFDWFMRVSLLDNACPLHARIQRWAPPLENNNTILLGFLSSTSTSTGPDHKAVKLGSSLK